MGILMDTVTTAMCICRPINARRGLPHTKPLKASHCSSTRLPQSVHPPKMKLDAVLVLVLVPLRSLHAMAIPYRPVRPLLRPHNPWLLPRQLACPQSLTGDRLRLPVAAPLTLVLGTTPPTLPLQIWMTSRRFTAALLPPIHGQGLYRPTSTPMDMHTTMDMTRAVNLSSMPMPWIWKLESQHVVTPMVR
jgi:hypothetical protein